MLLHVEIIFYLILGQIKYIVNFNSFSYTCILPSYVFWSVLVNTFWCLTFTTFFSFYPSVFLIGYFLMTCLPGHQEVHQFGFTYTDILTFILPIKLFSYVVFFNSRISIYFFSLQIMTVAMKLKDARSFARKVMTNLDSTLKSRDITLSTKAYPVKAMVFPVVIMDVRVGL